MLLLHIDIIYFSGVSWCSPFYKEPHCSLLCEHLAGLWPPHNTHPLLCQAEPQTSVLRPRGQVIVPHWTAGATPCPWRMVPGVQFLLSQVAQVPVQRGWAGNPHDWVYIRNGALHFELCRCHLAEAERRYLMSEIVQLLMWSDVLMKQWFRGFGNAHGNLVWESTSWYLLLQVLVVL